MITSMVVTIDTQLSGLSYDLANALFVMARKLCGKVVEARPVNRGLYRKYNDGHCWITCDFWISAHELQRHVWFHRQADLKLRASYNQQSVRWVYSHNGDYWRLSRYLMESLILNLATMRDIFTKQSQTHNHKMGYTEICPATQQNTNCKFCQLGGRKSNQLIHIEGNVERIFNQPLNNFR